MLFGDVKRSLAGYTEANITKENIPAVVEALSRHLGCNGIRIGIDPSISNPAGGYSDLYTTFYQYVREKGLSVYANPLGTGVFGKSWEDYASWIAAYANVWRPDYLGIFNEAAMPPWKMMRVIARVKKLLEYDVQLVGPDMMHLNISFKTLSVERKLADAFDILSSQDAEFDDAATPSLWTKFCKIAERAGKECWSTEDPRPWSKIIDGKEVGVKAVLQNKGQVSAIVLYLAYPHLVHASGKLTEKGKEIAEGLLRSRPLEPPSRGNDNEQAPRRGARIGRESGTDDSRGKGGKGGKGASQDSGSTCANCGEQQRGTESLHRKAVEPSPSPDGSPKASPSQAVDFSEAGTAEEAAIWRPSPAVSGWGSAKARHIINPLVPVDEHLDAVAE